MLNLPEKFWTEGIFLTTAEGVVHWGSGPFRFESQSDPAAPSFFAPEFFLRGSRPWIIPEMYGSFSRENWIVVDRIRASDEKIIWQPPKFSDFEQKFHEINEAFARRGLLKAVPVVGETARLRPDADWIARRCDALFRASDSLLPYGMWTENRGMLGASPEVLFSLRDKKLSTVALAGTLVRLPDSQIDENEALETQFLEDPKENYEHGLVVDDILARLSDFGRVVPGRRRVLRLARLSHMQTPIEVELSKSQNSTDVFSNLVRALHPTAALGVFPRSFGFRNLRRFSFQHRARFGAPFGFRAAASATCLVAIRNVQWNRGQITCGSGCGIVPASRLEKEWEELRAKRESVKALLEIL